MGEVGKDTRQQFHNQFLATTLWQFRKTTYGQDSNYWHRSGHTDLGIDVAAAAKNVKRKEDGECLDLDVADLTLRSGLVDGLWDHEKRLANHCHQRFLYYVEPCFGVLSV